MHFIKILFTFPEKKNFIDIPNERSSHTVNTPRGGGIIIVLFSLYACLINNFYIPIYCLPIAIIGLIDDKYSLSNKIRYLVQLITAVIVVSYSPFYNFLSNFNYNFLLNILIWIICVITFTAIVNFTNFMDGIDGIVSGCFFIIFISLSISLNLPLLIISSSIMSFLFFNWSPAKVFLGDVGSTFLGAMLATIIFSTDNFNDFIFVFGIAFPILIDPLLCILKRFNNKENIFKHHKKHFYQRLNQVGWSHQKISSIYISSYVNNKLSLFLLWN